MVLHISTLSQVKHSQNLRGGLNIWIWIWILFSFFFFYTLVLIITIILIENTQSICLYTDYYSEILWRHRRKNEAENRFYKILFSWIY